MVPTFMATRARLKALIPVSRLRTTIQIFEAAALYFAIVFAAGFVLGPVRELWAVPRFGQRVAELIEEPIMLLGVFALMPWLVSLRVVDSAANRTRGSINVQQNEATRC